MKIRKNLALVKVKLKVAAEAAKTRVEKKKADLKSPASDPAA